MTGGIISNFSGLTVVFDLDGTIADTSADLIEAANAALRTEGFPPATAASIKAGVGYGTKSMLQSAVKAMGYAIGPGQMERLAELLVAHYEANIARNTTLFPGFLQSALKLRESGTKLALCTNKRERLALKLLKALNIDTLFDAVAGGDTFAFHKPDPRHITELVCRAGGKPAAAIMIGDSEADVAAAKAANMFVIAVRFGYAAILPENLGADAVLDHFGDLVPLIEGLPVGIRGASR